MKTTLGDIKIRLYNETPLHRDNFIKLVNSGYYEGVSFHRVIKNFMIQAGDPTTKSGFNQTVIDSVDNLTIEAEFVPSLIHKKGALAAARQDNLINPLMRSSATQFYIVQGEKFDAAGLEAQVDEKNKNIRQAEFIRVFRHLSDSCKAAGSMLTDSEIQEKALLKLYDIKDKTETFKYTEQQKAAYIKDGGVPRLDGTYTVFGEVVEGMEIVDAIASEATDSSDKPFRRIDIIKMKIIKK